MCRIKICLIALATSLFLAGCGNSAEERSGISSTDMPPVSEPVSVPESSEKIESAVSTASDRSETYAPDNTSNNSSDTTHTETGEPLQNTSSQSESISTADTEPETPNESIPEANEMTITVNGKEFSAKFSDTKAAKKFKAMLPMTLDMSELNGNEKFFYLDDHLSAKSENIGHINSGDIMLYGSNCIVLFYDSFSTPYSYTRIGYIDDPDGLKDAVGKGSATVEFR